MAREVVDEVLAGSNPAVAAIVDVPARRLPVVVHNHFEPGLAFAVVRHVLVDAGPSRTAGVPGAVVDADAGRRLRVLAAREARRDDDLRTCRWPLKKDRLRVHYHQIS